MEHKKTGLYKKIEHWRMISLGLGIYDFLAVEAAFFLGLWLRFDCRFSMIPDHYLESYILYNSEIGLVVKKSLDTNHTSLAMGKDEHNDGSDKAHTYRGKSRAERAKVHSDNEYRVSYYNENIAAKGNNK